jgi:hypothetical protein
MCPKKKHGYACLSEIHENLRFERTLTSLNNKYVDTHLKKNMTVLGSYNSYMVLKSGTSVMSTR